MAITVHSTNTSPAGTGFSGAATITVTRGAVSQNDVMVMLAGWNGAATNVSPTLPSGWTQVLYDRGATNSMGGLVAVAVAGAAEPTTYSFTLGGTATDGDFFIYCLTGADTTPTISASTEQVNTGGTATITFPSFSFTSMDCCSILFFSAQTYTTAPSITWPTGWTNGLTVTDGTQGNGSAINLTDSTVATLPQQSVAAGKTVIYVAWQLAIKVAGGGVSGPWGDFRDRRTH